MPGADARIGADTHVRPFDCRSFAERGRATLRGRGRSRQQGEQACAREGVRDAHSARRAAVGAARS
eukprot:7698260-Alexandrium_andersonii.AAC.1